MSQPVPTNFAAFCMQRGLTHDDDVFSHINASLRSHPTSKTFARWNQRETARLQAERDEAKRLYREAIAQGEICEREMTLNEKCQGDSDNPAVQAAIRVREILSERGVEAKQ